MGNGASGFHFIYTFYTEFSGKDRQGGFSWWCEWNYDMSKIWHQAGSTGSMKPGEKSHSSLETGDTKNSQRRRTVNGLVLLGNSREKSTRDHGFLHGFIPKSSSFNFQPHFFTKKHGKLAGCRSQSLGPSLASPVFTRWLMWVCLMKIWHFQIRWFITDFLIKIWYSNCY